MGLPVERKVQASTGAAAVSGLALWVLGRYVFKGDVPDVVASWVYVIIPSVITFMAGYAAKHTARPDAAQPAPPAPPAPPAWAPKTLIPPAAARGADISPLADRPMEDLPAPVIPPAAPE